LRQAHGQVAAGQLSASAFWVLWYIYDRMWVAGRPQMVGAAWLASRLNAALRTTRYALRVLEDLDYIRCLTRGGQGRGVTNAYELGAGPGVDVALPTNVVELQPHRSGYNQKRGQLVAPLRPEKGARECTLTADKGANSRPKRVQRRAPRLEYIDSIAAATQQRAANHQNRAQSDLGSTAHDGIGNQSSEPKPRRRARRAPRPEFYAERNGQLICVPPPPPRERPIPPEFELTQARLDRALDLGLPRERIKWTFGEWKSAMARKGKRSSDWDAEWDAGVGGGSSGIVRTRRRSQLGMPGPRSGRSAKRAFGGHSSQANSYEDRRADPTGA
jgi:hypothetical protein